MNTKNGRVLQRALTAGAVALVGGVLALAFFPKAAKPLAMQAQSPALSVFCAPSHVPAGEHWILLGSVEGLADDLLVTPAAVGVTVLETQKLSKAAVGVRLTASSGVQEKLLRVSSASSGSETYPDLYQGSVPDSRTTDANFTEENFVNGQLVVDGQHIMYGYFPAGESPLAALRIHNRATGTWYRHEHAVEKALAASEVKVPDPPFFVEVNVLETLPDTDGNGVPDFADIQETKPPTQEQLGVELVSQTNVLDLVAVDEAGYASWRTINVFTTYTPSE